MPQPKLIRLHDRGNPLRWFVPERFLRLSLTLIDVRSLAQLEREVLPRLRRHADLLSVGVVLCAQERWFYLGHGAALASAALRLVGKAQLQWTNGAPLPPIARSVCTVELPGIDGRLMFVPRGEPGTAWMMLADLAPLIAGAVRNAVEFEATRSASDPMVRPL